MRSKTVTSATQQPEPSQDSVCLWQDHEPTLDRPVRGWASEDVGLNYRLIWVWVCAAPVIYITTSLGVLVLDLKISVLFVSIDEDSGSLFEVSMLATDCCLLTTFLIY